MTVKEVAKKLQVCSRTIVTRIHEGRLKANKIVSCGSSRGSFCWDVSEEQLAQYLQELNG